MTRLRSDQSRERSWGRRSTWPPNRCSGGVSTASADLFAMGAILYEMLAGAAAFEAETFTR